MNLLNFLICNFTSQSSVSVYLHIKYLLDRDDIFTMKFKGKYIVKLSIQSFVKIWRYY
jgi:hypothetical protein